MTKICCKVTAIPKTVKSPFFGILTIYNHQLLGKRNEKEKSREMWFHRIKDFVFLHPVWPRECRANRQQCPLL